MPLSPPAAEELTVAVAPTATIIGGPWATWLTEAIVVRIQNMDAVQSIDAWFELTWDDGTIYDLQQDNYFMGIPALAARQKEFAFAAHPAMRIMATASGAGANVRISVRRVNTLGGRRL